MDSKKCQCKLCGGCGTEKHRLYVCKGWHHISLDMESEVKHIEKIAPDDLWDWLWKKGLALSRIFWNCK